MDIYTININNYNTNTKVATQGNTHITALQCCEKCLVPQVYEMDITLTEQVEGRLTLSIH